ncbi:MAG: DNA polymerase IV [Acidimicrobiia bacterium]
MTVSSPEPAILHCDLDAFYASVEQLADPSLVGKPVIVGGLGPRGVVAAASYEARRFGVFSAMPMARARRSCPDGVFLAPRFDAYQDASRAVMGILRSYTPLVEPIALDEAFLDVSGARRRFGAGREIAAAIRARVRGETGLTVSVGVASTKFLAKLASDLSKPDGLLVVEPGEELAFLHPLAVEKLWGVGPATRTRLARLGVRTVGELAALGEDTLVAALGDARGRHLHALAHNVDERVVEPERTVKSIGHEETFPVDHTDPEVLRREVARLADRTAARLRAAGHRGRTVQLKVRFADFRTITRSRTLPAPTDLAADIAATARVLLDGVDVGEGVRLLGVSVQQLVETETPLALDFAAAGDGRRAALERSIDGVRSRFGPESVRPARLADSAPRPPARPGEGPGGPPAGKS